jgi:hypothetical protein
MDNNKIISNSLGTIIHIGNGTIYLKVNKFPPELLGQCSGPQKYDFFWNQEFLNKCKKLPTSWLLQDNFLAIYSDIFNKYIQV